MIIRALIGLALLSYGRKLFWLFVGGMGFILGVSLAGWYFGDQSEGVILLVGIIGGIIGAGLAIFLQKMAIGIAGFIAGGYGLLAIIELFNVSVGQFQFILYIIGGIIGAALVANLFEWAMILLSSLSGAVLLTQGLRLEGQLEIWVSILAFVAGAFIQSMMMGRKEEEN